MAHKPVAFHFDDNQHAQFVQASQILPESKWKSINPGDSIVAAQGLWISDSSNTCLCSCSVTRNCSNLCLILRFVTCLKVSRTRLGDLKQKGCSCELLMPADRGRDKISTAEAPKNGFGHVNSPDAGR